MKPWDKWENDEDDKEALKEYINDSCCFPIKYKTKRDDIKKKYKPNKVIPVF